MLCRNEGSQHYENVNTRVEIQNEFHRLGKLTHSAHRYVYVVHIKQCSVKLISPSI